MTKVLIVSDSHGSAAVLQELKERHGTSTDLFIHCGDSELQPTDEAIVGFAAVKGNCDYKGSFPEDLVQEAGGRRILITHGHLYSVKTSLNSLSYRTAEVEADIVCFGHSHILGAEQINGKLFINPGSILLPRSRREKTYVILTLEKDSAILDVFDFDNGELPELRQIFPF